MGRVHRAEVTPMAGEHSKKTETRVTACGAREGGCLLTWLLHEGSLRLQSIERGRNGLQATDVSQGSHRAREKMNPNLAFPWTAEERT